MKTEEQLLAIAEGYRAMGNPCYKGLNFVVCVDGAMYPFWMKRLQNPLDPRQQLRCMPKQGFGHAAMQVLETCAKATELRNAGFTVVERSASGAPRVISVGGRVIILGELCKEKGYIYPMLCTQIAGPEYDQSKIKVWGDYGFSTAKPLDVKPFQQSNPIYTCYEVGDNIYYICNANASFTVEHKPLKYSTTTPRYAWQDKGETDEN